MRFKLVLGFLALSLVANGVLAYVLVRTHTRTIPQVRRRAWKSCPKIAMQHVLYEKARKHARRLGKKLVVIGNVDILLFNDGTKKQIEKAAKWCIDTVAPYGAFVLSSACEIPPTAPLENIDYFMSFAKAYGRYERMVPGWVGYRI